MRKTGVYYMPRSDKIIIIRECEYFEDFFNPAFSIVTWEEPNGKVYEKTLITKDQFKRFKYLGDL